MAKYDIEVGERFYRIVEVEAASKNEALDKAELMYEDSQIVLDSGDIEGTAVFRCLGLSENN